MQGRTRSSKDKHGDYAQSLESLSLSDSGDHLPRSDSYGSSYAEVYGSSYEQPSTGDVTYSWTAQSSLAPIQSSSAVYSGTPGYGSSYTTTNATSLTGGYQYRIESSATPAYSGDTGYATASVTSSSVPSSSKTHSNRTDVHNYINHQPPPNERYQLPCEFHNLTGCTRVFGGDDVQDWMDHVEGHLQSKFPTRLRCWFCNEHNFDARETSEGDVRSNFDLRMHHIRHHIVYEGYRPDPMQKDGLLVQHLLDRNLIDRRTYESIVAPTPHIPDSQGGHSRHRSQVHHSHRRLPQVEEEVVAEPSSRHHHRSEHRGEYRREHHRGRRSGRVPRHRYTGDRISVPAVDHPDDAVLRSLGQPPNSRYSSKVLGNTSLEGSRISSRNNAIQYSKNPSIEHTGDETVAKASTNELQQINTELVRQASSCPPEQIKSPQSQDHSNDGSSSYSTDTSTPESHSFWLAEYSEDEDNKLDEDHRLNQFRASAIARVIEAFSAWKQAHVDQDLPCDGAGKSNTAPNQGKGKGKSSATGKRKRADQAGNREDTADNGAPSSSQVRSSERLQPCARVGRSEGSQPSDQVGSSKRSQNPGQQPDFDDDSGDSGPEPSSKKVKPAKQLFFACPYAKKDPRLHQACYMYKLSRIRDVKQHLFRRHLKPPYCPTCMSTFQTEKGRDDHIRGRTCESRPWITLDGITEPQRKQLGKKSAANSSPEAQWYAIFDILFPGHKPRPLSPYVNRELIQDITLFENYLMSDGPSVVSEVFTQHGASGWKLPNEERERAAFLRPIFEEGFSILCEQWRTRSSSSSQDSNVPPGSGSSSQNTPPSSSNSGEGAGPSAVHDSGAVPPVTAGSPPDGGPSDALPEGADIPENSADHFSFGEGLDETFAFEHSGFESPAGPSCDIDEMMRLFMDDAQASSSSEFPPDLG